MLCHRSAIPLDYSLCAMTVTIYTPGGERRVKSGVHFQVTHEISTENGRSTPKESFLLVIPGADPIAPGDKVVLGVGPEDVSWETLHTGACLVRSVTPRYFRDTLCHTEARG